MNQRFADKVAVVTGAASGIGEAVMIHLAEEGATVVALDRDAARLETAVASVPGNRAVAKTCDVADQASVDNVINGVASEFGRIDVLINNAGIGPPVRGRLHEIKPGDWDKVIAVNVKGVYLLLRAVIPHMLAQGKGSIVNMASVGSFRATPMSSSYITSKGAVLMMTRSAAIDYAADNIRVNAVCPGTTRTDILANTTEEQMEFLVSRSPQKRLGEPEEVAALVAFLASDEAPHINGSAYIIDGGRCAC